MHFIEKKGLLFMKQGSKIGIVCCSNGLRPEQAETIKMLVQILEKSGLEVDLSPYLYGDENGQAGTARERAGALMKFYEDDSVTDIFDVLWIWESPKGYRSMYVKLHRLEILLR